MNLTKNSLTAEKKWLERANELTSAELESPFWLDLQRALRAAGDGESECVAQWIDDVEKTFLLHLNSYKSGDLIEEEIALESVLCHRLLVEGAECWLEALAEFRGALGRELDGAAVVARAGRGQRLLTLVRLIHEETEQATGRILAWARE